MLMCLVFRFHENTTCKKMDARLDRQAKWSTANTALQMNIGHIVGHQSTQALVISVLTTIDMAYSAKGA